MLIFCEVLKSILIFQLYCTFTLQFSFDRWVDPAGVYFYAAEVVELVGNASKAYIQKQVIQLFEFPVSYKHFFQINAKCAANNKPTC